jgi:hypothetical protein
MVHEKIEANLEMEMDLHQPLAATSAAVNQFFKRNKNVDLFDKSIIILCTTLTALLL